MIVWSHLQISLHMSALQTRVNLNLLQWKNGFSAQTGGKVLRNQLYFMKNIEWMVYLFVCTTYLHWLSNIRLAIFSPLGLVTGIVQV